MDTKTSWFIKNGTCDTFLIDVTLSYSLADWYEWNKQDFDHDIPKDAPVLTNAVITGFVLPDSTLFHDPDRIEDTCYIYAVKWSVVKKYSIREIREKMYTRQMITKNKIHNRMVVYGQ